MFGKPTRKRGIGTFQVDLLRLRENFTDRCMCNFTFSSLTFEFLAMLAHFV